MTHSYHCTRARSALAAICVLVVLGCGDEEQDTTGPGSTEPLFARYVALGNSVTAGYESGGINDSTQSHSYAVLLAKQMGLSIGSGFVLPAVTSPGCPPPIVNIFTQERVGMGSSTDCAGISASDLPHNVAIPGAKVIDALSTTDPRSSPNVFTQLFLGGQTQLDAAAALSPTFVTVALGNNDALAAALGGDPAALTPFDQFEEDYRNLADGLVAMGVQGALLFGVGQVTRVPNLSPGAAYWVASMQPSWPPTFTVDDNCATTAAGGAGEATLVPFAYGFGQLMATVQAGGQAHLNCLTDAPLLTLTEISQIVGAVARFNTVIERIANEHGWAYLDINPLLDSLAAAGEFPLFPNISGLDALLRPFGDFFSRDGFHPAAALHELFARKAIDAINARYGQPNDGQSIPQLP